MIGERINNYSIVSLLGEGGMGTVFAARHLVIGRMVAVKVMRREHAENRALVARFINEARAADAIRHPNIVDILDVGTLPDGRPYLMMELLRGETLARRVRRQGRLSLAEALGHADRISAALAAAHAQSIVHRDLKPDNVFLVDDARLPPEHRLKVLDFGIAKLKRDLGGDSYRTNTGALLGTPPYMSPEQCRGLTEEIDQRTDIYALGIILYEMLCGAPPFTSRAFGDVLMMHMSVPPRPPREINPEIPPEIESGILRALAKERAARFASVHDLQLALGRPALATLVAPAPDAEPEMSADRSFPPEAAIDTKLLPSEPTRSSPPPPMGNGPATAATTFSSTASQFVAQQRPQAVAGRARRRILATLVVGAGVAAAGVGLLTRGRRGGEGEPAATTPRVAPARVAPTPTPVALPPPELPVQTPAAQLPAARQLAGPPDPPAGREPLAPGAAPAKDVVVAERPVRKPRPSARPAVAKPPPRRPAAVEAIEEAPGRPRTADVRKPAVVPSAVPPPPPAPPPTAAPPMKKKKPDVW